MSYSAVDEHRATREIVRYLACRAQRVWRVAVKRVRLKGVLSYVEARKAECPLRARLRLSLSRAGLASQLDGSKRARTVSARAFVLDTMSELLQFVGTLDAWPFASLGDSLGRRARRAARTQPLLAHLRCFVVFTVFFSIASPPSPDSDHNKGAGRAWECQHFGHNCECKHPGGLRNECEKRLISDASY